MILFHGSNVQFDEIDLMKSKPNKDFGRGFYLSDNVEQALELAKIKVEQLETGSPVVMKYELDEQQLSSLKVLRFKEYDEEWAKFILLNRNNPSQTAAHDFDVVIGPIANDRVGLQLWRYESGSIDLQTLVKRLNFMKGITIQYFFGTERAVKLLKRI